MRRWLVAVATGSLLVACGLSIEGLAPAPEPVDAGPEAAPTTTATATTEPPVIDAPAPTHDCHVRTCHDDDDDGGVEGGTCYAESCVTDDGGAHWPLQAVSAGGSLAEIGGLCHSTTIDAGPQTTATVVASITPLPARFRYDVWVDVQTETGGTGATVLVGFDGPTTNGYVFATPAGTTYAACESPTNDPNGWDCGAPLEAGTPTPAFVHVYGRIDSASDAGTGAVNVEVADSPTSCVEVQRQTFPQAPFDHLNVFAGCFGQLCDRTWTNAVVKVTPE